MVVEVYREPLDGTFTTTSHHRHGDVLTVPGLEDIDLAVSDVLPPIKAP